MPNPYWRQRDSSNAKVIGAGTERYAYVRAMVKIADWLEEEAALQKLPVSRMAWPIPLYPVWRQLSGNRRARLPHPEIIFSQLRRGHPNKTEEQLLRIALRQVVAKIDPPTDVAYVRRCIDAAKISLPSLTLRSKRGSAIALGEVISTTYGVHSSSATPIGRAVLNLLDAPKTHEAWLDRLQFVAEAKDPNHFLAAHVIAAERAHSDDYTLRTPPDTPLSPMARGAWQRMAELGVATVAELGHFCIAPHPKDV